MSVTVAVGTHWGDEGKAKVVDFLTEKNDIVVRFQGGANAGHTVIADGETWIFHQIPAGILHPGKVCVVGNGVVLDPLAFLEELDHVRGRGVSVEGRLWISDRAHLVMPYHKQLEGIQEAARGTGAIGTTKRGIGPTYYDKISREHGLRAGDLLDAMGFRTRLRKIVADKNEVFTRVYGAEPVNADAVADEYLGYAEQMRPFIADTATILHAAQNAGKAILCEGAQGTLLDIDHGTYPFVTSSNTSAGGACTGTGIGPTAISEVIGIVKAYTSRVGNGPFPTEFECEMGNRMRELWNEYGATTRRPRRCGWLDGVILEYSARINGLTGLAVTALDRLDALSELRICREYVLDGTPLHTVPARTEDFDRVKAVYDTLPGWETDTTSARCFEELPENARRYIRRIEEIAGVPVRYVGIGPERDQMIVVRSQTV
ncbi:MAG TPA: adenylosuccinate synthase [Candidatus Latescibacteria bacterium]|nr:adenylosuccinate synthase [Candidatus Latescibacterota bacterium]HOF60756.1 adenylosuccinate synthase [Candidatus Latescibacterota bacterium]HOS64855.1 adenylosuccinate synthase [Candidatus Latescibacterota bacterium]HPK73477.1 adenylosuccinate synthase [Candidatus Latescibacterota bacterium]